MNTKLEGTRNRRGREGKKETNSGSEIITRLYISESYYRACQALLVILIGCAI